MCSIYAIMCYFVALLEVIGLLHEKEKSHWGWGRIEVLVTASSHGRGPHWGNGDNKMDFFVSQAIMQNGVEFINESKKPLFVVVVVDGDGEQDETTSMVHGCYCYCVEAKVHFLCSYWRPAGFLGLEGSHGAPPSTLPLSARSPPQRDLRRWHRKLEIW